MVVSVRREIPHRGDIAEVDRLCFPAGLVPGGFLFLEMDVLQSRAGGSDLHLGGGAPDRGAIAHTHNKLWWGRQEFRQFVDQAELSYVLGFHPDQLIQRQGDVALAAKSTIILDYTLFAREQQREQNCIKDLTSYTEPCKISVSSH